ncbi:MAG: hypothetical protein ACRDZW_11170, partial [Acidimicrobiales bacterium]
MQRFVSRLLVALAVLAGASVTSVPMAWGAPQTRLAVLEDADTGAGEAVPFPATHLGLRWSGDDQARVQLRWQEDGAWRPWQDAAVAHDLEDDARGLVYSGLVRVDRAGRVETRV